MGTGSLGLRGALRLPCVVGSSRGDVFMRKLNVRARLGLRSLIALAFGLQPPPVAVSSFIYYVDINSAATSDCLPTASGCTGQCAVPTCGSSGTPCHKIQDALN